jgi:hypothetical protein
MKDRAFNMRFAVLLLASLLCTSVSFAAPAASDGPGSGSQPRMPGLANATMQSAFRAKIGALTARPKLDLRIPAATKPMDGYPSAPGRNGLGAGSQNAAAFQLSFAKPRSPTEEFVNRVHHEGLPLARLWENKSALVSLGLNQRGQAGLWLIQKTP